MIRHYYSPFNATIASRVDDDAYVGIRRDDFEGLKMFARYNVVSFIHNFKDRFGDDELLMYRKLLLQMFDAFSDLTFCMVLEDDIHEFNSQDIEEFACLGDVYDKDVLRASYSALKVDCGITVSALIEHDPTLHILEHMDAEQRLFMKRYFDQDFLLDRDMSVSSLGMHNLSRDVTNWLLAMFRHEKEKLPREIIVFDILDPYACSGKLAIEDVCSNCAKYLMEFTSIKLMNLVRDHVCNHAYELGYNIDSNLSVRWMIKYMMQHGIFLLPCKEDFIFCITELLMSDINRSNSNVQYMTFQQLLADFSSREDELYKFFIDYCVYNQQQAFNRLTEAKVRIFNFMHIAGFQSHKLLRQNIFCAMTFNIFKEGSESMHKDFNWLILQMCRMSIYLCHKNHDNRKFEKMKEYMYHIYKFTKHSHGARFRNFLELLFDGYDRKCKKSTVTRSDQRTIIENIYTTIFRRLHPHVALDSIYHSLLKYTKQCS